MLQRSHNHAHLFLSLALLAMTIALTEPLLIWVQVLVVSAVGMHFALFLNVQKHLPTIRTVNLLAVLSALMLIYTGWEDGLLIFMLNLLVMGGALKLMTLRRYRDFFRLNGAIVFLIGGSFIFEQSISSTIIAALSIALLLLSLAYHVTPLSRWQSQLKRVFLQCIQALPIAVLLFLIIPKLEPMWRMPASKNAETGLSEKVTPGDIANLSQSSDLAFRATFDNTFPAMNQRYWRALVLEDFDGTSWRISPQRHVLKQQQLRRKQNLSAKYTGKHYRYEILTEPTQQQWLYSLDVPYTRTRGVWVSDDYQIQHRAPVHSQFKYQVDSYYEMPLRGGTTAFIKELNLQLPAKSNPKTRSWVAELRSKHADDKEFIEAVKVFFKQENFRYTLRPSPMPQNSVDQLLFHYRAGFCAHYASAAALVMRLAGIPARLVTGYLGGEQHESGYLSVYQYDAHAWIEVWLEDTGWTRFDPTALVAPDRAMYGLEQAVAYENTFLADTPFSLAKLKDVPWANLLRITLADMDYVWSRWLLGFDQRRQLDFFESVVGNLSPLRVAGLTVSVVLGIGLFLFIFQYRIWFPRVEDPLLHDYSKTVAMLKKKGIVKPTGMAPNEFAKLVQQKTTPDCGEHFVQLTQEFVRLRYQVAQVTPQQLHAFKQNVKMFKRHIG